MLQSSPIWSIWVLLHHHERVNEFKMEKDHSKVAFICVDIPKNASKFEGTHKLDKA